MNDFTEPKTKQLKIFICYKDLFRVILLINVQSIINYMEESLRDVSKNITKNIKREMNKEYWGIREY